MIALAMAFCGFARPCGAITIPGYLSHADRQEVVETLGLTSSTKLLSNPYPLGGYSGFEVGYSISFINIRDISRLGCAVGSTGCPNTETSTEDELRYSKITIGKGLYNNIDLFMHFAPPVGDAGISEYGGALRWGFYQAEFLPINVSLVLHANQINVQDKFVGQNLGYDFIAGVNVDGFSLYFGGGQIYGKGSFIGGSSGTATVDPSDPELGSDNTVVERVSQTHSLVGAILQFDHLFAAAQIDHYKNAVYSLKVGLRY